MSTFFRLPGNPTYHASETCPRLHGKTTTITLIDAAISLLKRYSRTSKHRIVRRELRGALNDFNLTRWDTLAYALKCLKKEKAEESQ